MNPSTNPTSLESLIAAAHLCRPDLEALCLVVLTDRRWQSGYGAQKHHHNWPGGLVEHTAEVMRYALLLAEHLGAELDVLIPGVIWHDWAKIHDYLDEIDSETGLVKLAPYSRAIHHVSGSYGEFVAQARVLGIAEDYVRRIGHCILAHHGRPEWGSPVEPQSKEAFILHYADMLSSRFPGLVAGSGGVGA